MIRSSTILQHIKSAPLPRGALFVCLPNDSPTRHELLSRIVILNGEKRGGKATAIQAFPAWVMLLSKAAERSWLPIGGAPRRGEGATQQYCMKVLKYR